MKTVYVLKNSFTDSTLAVFDNLDLVDKLIHELSYDSEVYKDYEEKCGCPMVVGYCVDEMGINTLQSRTVLVIEVVNGVITKKEKLDNEFYDLGKGDVE